MLEEIYYYEIAAGPTGPGVGYQRVYGPPDRPIDLLVEVRDGNVVLVPHGWHGPAMAGARIRPVLPQGDGRARP